MAPTFVLGRWLERKDAREHTTASPTNTKIARVGVANRTNCEGSRRAASEPYCFCFGHDEKGLRNQIILAELVVEVKWAILTEE